MPKFVNNIYTFFSRCNFWKVKQMLQICWLSKFELFQFIKKTYKYIFEDQFQSLDIRVPCFCYGGLPLVVFWRFYCIKLDYEVISPLVDNTVHQATQLFIILLKTKKLKIVEYNTFNVLVQRPLTTNQSSQTLTASNYWKEKM